MRAAWIRPLALPLLVGAASVVGGYLVGVIFWGVPRTTFGSWGFRRALLVTSYASVLGLTLELLEIFLSLGRKPSGGPAALLGYSAVLVFWEPQLTVYEWRGVLVIVVFLVPLVSGLVIVLSRRAWASGIGAALLLFAATLSLTYNVQGWNSGLGFVTGWIE